MQKLKFLFVLPIVAITIALCSFVKNEKPVKEKGIPGMIRKRDNAGIPIRKIKWIGNTIYTDQQLSNIVGMHPGDPYDAKTFSDKLNEMKETALASLYMDQGYLFFRTEVVEKKIAEKVDLEITLYEGNKVKIGKILVKGNGDVPVQEVLDKIAIEPGEFFSRKKVINAQRAIAEMGKFNAKNVNINPFPDEKSKTGDGGYVDLEFTMERK